MNVSPYGFPSLKVKNLFSLWIDQRDFTMHVRYNHAIARRIEDLLKANRLFHELPLQKISNADRNCQTKPIEQQIRSQSLG